VPYVSAAYPYTIFTWPAWAFWSVILALAALSVAFVFT